MRGILGAVLVSFMGACSSSTPAAAPADAGVDAGPPLPPLEGDYSCRGKITYPAPVTASANIDFTSSDAFSKVADPNVSVKACALDDVACATPLVTTTTNGSGTATLALPLGSTGFGGYLEVSFPEEAPNLNFISPPITDDRTYQRVYWSKAALTRLADLGDFTYDPTRGQVFIEAHDCVEYPNGINCGGHEGCKLHGPGGIAFELDVQDPAMIVAYIVPPSISRTAGGTYEGIGQGGFINVPPGPVTVIGRVAQTGEIVSRQKVFVRAGAISLLVLQPIN